MGFPQCGHQGRFHICFDKSSNQVVLQRCCIKGEEVTRVSLSDFNQLDVISWCSSFLKKNPPNHNFQCSKFFCNFEEEDNTVLGVDVALSQACNLKCSFCFMGNTHSDSPEMKTAYFSTLYQLKNKNISLRLTDNGEPFIYKQDIMKFLLSCSNQDFVDIRITTNGTLLSYDDIFKLKESGLNVKFTLSLDSYDNEEYKKLRGGDVSKVIEIAKSLRSFGLLEAINTVWQKTNFEHAEELFQFVQSQGVPHLSCFFYGDKTLELSEAEKEKIMILRKKYNCKRDF